MRRLASILFYVVAGCLLVTEMMVAFFDPADIVDGSGRGVKMATMAIMLALALVPLALGLWASPGRRLRELGILLLTAAGICGAEATIVAYMILMPDTGALFPPGTAASLDAVWTGFLNLALMAGAGWWLVRRGRAEARGADAAEGASPRSG